MNEAHEIRDELTKENILEKFQDAFHEHAFTRIIELGGAVAKKAVMHKLDLD